MTIDVVLSGDLAKQSIKFLEEFKREFTPKQYQCYMVNVWFKDNIKVYRKTKSKQSRYVRVVKK